MKQYAEHKEQLEGLTDVHETVKTIEKIAASSIHTARLQARRLATYERAIEATLARCAAFVTGVSHPLLHPHTTEGSLLVVVTSDKGDVGGLWHRIVEETLMAHDSYDALLCIGSKGARYLAEHGITPIDVLPAFPDDLDHSAIQQTNEYVRTLFVKGAYASIDVLYPNYQNFTEQGVVHARLLPLSYAMTPTADSDVAAALGFPVFEPSPTSVYQALLSKFAARRFTGLAAEAKLAELVARTVAMEHAAAQTEELIRTTTHAFRRLRREALTDDQIVSMTSLLSL